MSRSTKKGPYIHPSLLKKVQAMAKGNDKRVIKTAGPLVIQAAFSSAARRDAEMISALAASPFTASANQKHVPTLAEQAPGGQAIPRLGLFRVLEKKPQSTDSNSHPQQ